MTKKNDAPDVVAPVVGSQPDGWSRPCNKCGGFGGHHTGCKGHKVNELTDMEILACLDDRKPTMTHYGAAVFEYRLCALIDFARRVIAAKQEKE
jgi:hypothetical protein